MTKRIIHSGELDEEKFFDLKEELAKIRSALDHGLFRELTPLEVRTAKQAADSIEKKSLIARASYRY